MAITNEIFYRIALRSVPEIGDITSREILQQAGNAEWIFKTTLKELKNFISSEILLNRFEREKENALKKAEQIVQDIQRLGIDVVLWDEEWYPKRLFYLNDAPFILFYKGERCWNEEYSVGVVGTRSPDGYGKKMTYRILEELASYRPLIVSGMALGIDGYAHDASLRNNLKTIGVMGHGLDMVYPSVHKKLARIILDYGGALVSEFPPGTQPEPQYFPRRNRILAGMTDALLVVQSRMKGGSMITATIAHSYNKDVFAIPGPCDEPLSEGPHGLIKMNKATLAESGYDIAHFMNWKIRVKNPDNQEKPEGTDFHQARIPIGEENEFFTRLRFKKRKWHLDEIIQEMNVPYSKVAQMLTMLEMNGLILKHPGNVIEFL